MDTRIKRLCRWPRRLLAGSLLLAGAAAISACSGAGSAAPPAAAEAPAELSPLAAQLSAALPAPAALTRQASAPPDDNDRLLSGSYSDSTLPQNNCSSGYFSPLYDAGAPQLSAAAWGCYRFYNMAEYSGVARIWIRWTDPPGEPPAGSAFVALANYSANRWDWYALPAGSDLPLESFTPYFSPAGEVIALVLLLGTTEYEIDWILAGDNAAPYVDLDQDLDPDPLQRLAPLTVNFDCADSEAYGATVASFDFDWESDGSYDLLDDPDGLASHIFSPGNYSTTVRVTDSDGVSNTKSVSFIAINPANQAPSAAFMATPDFGQAPIVADLIPDPSLDPDGELIKYEWDFDDDGVYDLTTATEDIVSYTFGVMGLNPVTLRVTDNDLATATFTDNVECINGWRRYEVDAAVPTYEPLAVATTGSGAAERACVAYQDSVTDILYYRQAATSTATSWNARVALSDGSLPTGFSPSMQRGIADDLPLLAYGTLHGGVDYHLMVRHCSSADGTAWDSPVVVDGSRDVGKVNSLRFNNATPGLASIEEFNSSSQSTILYYQALDNTGSSWSTARVAVPAEPGAIFSALSLGQCGADLLKRPLLAYARRTSTSSLHLISGADAGGLAWNAPLLLSTDDVRDTAQLVINGRPALHAGNPAQNGELRYARADDVEAAAFGGLAVNGGGGYGNLALFNGKPAACYFDFEGQDLWFVTALDVDGSSWAAPYRVDSAGSVGMYCQMVQLGGSLVIVYYDQTGQRIKAAYFELT